ncbi:hypothetical protein WA158_007190 [Blastocystis sp. Blastoise]
MWYVDYPSHDLKKLISMISKGEINYCDITAKCASSLYVSSSIFLGKNCQLSSDLFYCIQYNFLCTHSKFGLDFNKPIDFNSNETYILTLTKLSKNPCDYILLYRLIIKQLRITSINASCTKICNKVLNALTDEMEQGLFPYLESIQFSSDNGIEKTTIIYKVQSVANNKQSTNMILTSKYYVYGLSVFLGKSLSPMCYNMILNYVKDEYINSFHLELYNTDKDDFKRCINYLFLKNYQYLTNLDVVDLGQYGNNMSESEFRQYVTHSAFNKIKSIQFSALNTIGGTQFDVLVSLIKLNQYPYLERFIYNTSLVVDENGVIDSDQSDTLYAVRSLCESQPNLNIILHFDSLKDISTSFLSMIYSTTTAVLSTNEAIFQNPLSLYIDYVRQGRLLIESPYTDQYIFPKPADNKDIGTFFNSFANQFSFSSIKLTCLDDIWLFSLFANNGSMKQLEALTIDLSNICDESEDTYISSYLYSIQEGSLPNLKILYLSLNGSISNSINALISLFTIHVFMSVESFIFSYPKEDNTDTLLKQTSITKLFMYINSICTPSIKQITFLNVQDPLDMFMPSIFCSTSFPSLLFSIIFKDCHLSSLCITTLGACLSNQKISYIRSLSIDQLSAANLLDIASLIEKKSFQYLYSLTLGIDDTIINKDKKENIISLLNNISVNTTPRLYSLSIAGNSFSCIDSNISLITLIQLFKDIYQKNNTEK